MVRCRHVARCGGERWHACHHDSLCRQTFGNKWTHASQSTLQRRKRGKVGATCGVSLRFTISSVRVLKVARHVWGCCLCAFSGWSILDTNGRQFKIRTWQGGGIENGITHQAGECMRTWEVIAKSGLHSYDIMANRTYVPAMRALHDELLKRARDNGNKRGKRGLV